MNRRAFIISTGCLTINPSFNRTALAAVQPKIWRGIDLSWSAKAPPLFCTAYIDPYIPQQGGQQARIARYPIAIVPQDDRPLAKAWRDDIRLMNPSIKLIAYQMVIEETTVPGPGHRVLGKASGVWAKWPGGYQPKVKLGPNKFRRIFDPRDKRWQTAFLDACSTTLESDNYAGLMLDQCTIFDLASPVAGVRVEMLNALEATLKKLKQRHPDAFLIGNAHVRYPALSGQYIENSAEHLMLGATSDKTTSDVTFYQALFPKLQDNLSRAIDVCERSLSAGYLFSVASNYQKVEWPSFFDEIQACY